MKKILILLMFASCIHANTWKGEKIDYAFSLDPIDVVIPCHKKDCRTLEKVISGIKKHILHRRLIVVSSERLTDNAEWFDEKNYPMSMKDIAYELFQDEGKAVAYMQDPRTRIGWIYQQFLKLYASFAIPDISKNVLVVDADTIFFKPVTFLTESGAPMFNVGTEFHPPYFTFMDRLLPGIEKIFPDYSGICHHMLLQKPVLQDLFEIVEQIHQLPFWKAVCHLVDHSELYGSCFSEYELYFNFLFTRSNQAKIRVLNFDNFSWRSFDPTNKKGYDYASYHSWIG